MVKARLWITDKFCVSHWQTGPPLFRPMWASSVQCRHWSRPMEKASFTKGVLKKYTNSHKKIGVIFFNAPSSYHMPVWLTLAHAEQVQTPNLWEISTCGSSKLSKVKIFTDILAGFTFNNRVLRLPAIVFIEHDVSTRKLVFDESRPRITSQ